MTRQYKWTIRFSLLTPFLLIVALLAMGGGHGTYVPAMSLFPFGKLGVLLQDRISLPFILVALVQYPTYGFILDKVNSPRKLMVAGLPILLIHIGIVVLILKLSGENWR